MAGKSVVVGYNGKPHGRKALAWAAREAARRDAPLRVVFAANYPGMTLGPGPGLLQADPGALDAATEVVASGAGEALASQPGLRVSGTVEVTSPAKTLTDAAADAALLVIGNRGHGAILGALLGSVAFEVAARASCPVVVVKDAGGRRAHPAHHVVVGTDGSPEATRAVRFAADHATSLSATLQIITATGELPVAEVSEGRLRSGARRIVDAARDEVRRAHPRLSITARVDVGPAERALVDASAAADLVVVGTRGRGAFRGLLLGSASHAVIHGALCPVGVVGAGRGYEDSHRDISAEPADRTGQDHEMPLDLVETWGLGSFPASDPPANW